MKPTRVEFDIDNCLIIDRTEVDPNLRDKEIKGYQVPYRTIQQLNPEIFQLLTWYLRNGHRVYLWSGGGVEYAERIRNRYFSYEDVGVMPKEAVKNNDGSLYIDICYDDQDVNLGKVNVKVEEIRWNE